MKTIANANNGVFILYTKAEYMDQFMMKFNELFSSSETYMKFLDLPEKEIIKIKAKLID